MFSFVVVDNVPLQWVQLERQYKIALTAEQLEGRKKNPWWKARNIYSQLVFLNGARRTIFLPFSPINKSLEIDSSAGGTAQSPFLALSRITWLYGGLSLSYILFWDRECQRVAQETSLDWINLNEFIFWPQRPNSNIGNSVVSTQTSRQKNSKSCCHQLFLPSSMEGLCFLRMSSTLSENQTLLICY